MKIIDKQENDFHKRYGFILKLLENSNLKFKIITGKHEVIGSLEESKINKQYVPDIDIVFDAKKKTIKQDLEKCGFMSIEGIAYVYSLDKSIHIDAYSKYISVGSLKIFKPSFEDKLLKIKEEEYYIYQLVEPLLKFGFYYKRHLTRIKIYEENTDIYHAFVDKQLHQICFPVKFLLSKALEKDGKLSKSEYFLLKSAFILKPKNIYNYILLRLKLLTQNK